MTAASTSASASSSTPSSRTTKTSLSLVSVIIRTKDRPEELGRALRSLAEQTHGRIEAVVVNDGGGNVEKVCEEARGSLTSLKIVTPPAPGGRVQAANAGLEAASGDYLIFLDDDDWFHADHLEKLVEALEADPSAGTAYTGIECVQANAEGALERVHEYDQPFDHATLRIRNFIPIHALLFRRRFVDEGLRLDESLSLYEDWDFWLQLAERTEFRYVPGVSGAYFLAPGSGFALRATDEIKLAAEEQVLGKWKEVWTASTLREVVAQARKVPELRHGLHLAELGRDTLRRDMDVLRNDLGMARTEVEHLKRQGREADARYEDLQHSLDEILRSSSWRLTAPLRFLVRKWRAAAQPLRDTRLRLRNAARIIVREGPRVYWEHVRARAARQSAPVSRRAYPIEEIAPEALADAARDLSLPAAAEPVVSIVIPVYNHLDLTLACLRSIARHGARRPFEVIVVDDASSDRSAELLPSVANLRYLRNEANLGFVHSCNHGALQARGEYLLFLNNDTEVLEGWLDPLVDVLENRADAGVVGSKLIYPSGHLQEAGTSLHADGTVTLIGLNEDPDDPVHNRLRQVDHCSGACLLIRRAHFQELGGFDERYAPAYFEDCDLSLRMREKGYKVYYQPKSEVIHHLSKTTDENSAKLRLIERNKAVYLERWGKKLREQDKVRVIAFYLPQFHPIPENDEWWGKGFTEWTNVAKARPNFKGHYQPHQPADLGYYDLRLAEVREEQARLAREHGIHGFCYYYYWFGGKRLLERPLNDMLASGKPDFPFCVCWANENWTRRWDGRDAEILIAQDYSSESNLAFIQELLPLFRDPRYIRIDGRPLLVVYRADLIPDLAATVKAWRAEARKAGVGELYLAAVEIFERVKSEPPAGFDALVEFPPHIGSRPPSTSRPRTVPGFHGNIYDYRRTAEALMARELPEGTLFRGVMPSWDNTARRQDNPNVFINASPWEYERWLAHVAAQTRHMRAGDERIVFVNAWNEWAEGNHLEPDRKHGHAWLEATRSALGGLGVHDADVEREPDRDAHAHRDAPGGASSATD